MFCDLHMHSTASDGTDPPGALGALASAAGLSAIALTDHDTTAGVAAAEKGCRAAGVAFAAGIEISADPAFAKPPKSDPAQETSGTLHILGLFVRPDDEQLAAISRQMEQARNQRNPMVIDRLNAIGVRIDYSEVEALAAEEGTAIIGRPHIAQVLLMKGYVKSIQDAFTRYIGIKGAAYVRRDRLHPHDAINAIHHAGGLAVMAHPVQLRYADEDELTYIVRRMIDFGLDAIEARHSDHTPAQVQQFEKLAAREKIMTSGGSDYHGTRKTVAMGGQNVPFDVYERLRGAAEAALSV
ncbi:MAG: PHP domain-containing protein [Phycisphaeraceae bacterium]